MKIILNGEQINLSGNMNIAALLAEYNLDRKKIAVEKNLEIVPQSSFEEAIINEGDNIEIIHFIGGG